MTADEDVASGKLKLKQEAPDGSRKRKKHKKIEFKHLSSLKTRRSSQLQIKAKESDVRQETVYVYDDFWGKEVPDTGQTGGRTVCGKWDHYHMSCPCLKYFPKGTLVGFLYETMCRGCDRIGEVCCDKGGYALMKSCCYCNSEGHWQWEDSEDCCRPKEKVYQKPEFFHNTR